MYNRLISFVVKNNVFLEAQNGFGEKKPTETASQLFIESIQEALDKGVHAIGLFFDLSRAYDVINNDLLLDKLNSYGIRGKTYSWFKSYLTYHVQFVERNQTDHKNAQQNRYISSSREIMHGVPQGSVLGPLFIHSYIYSSHFILKGYKHQGYGFCQYT
jgi:hypothetical protein